jgi:hypothetical protein
MKNEFIRFIFGINNIKYLEIMNDYYKKPNLFLEKNIEIFFLKSEKKIKNKINQSNYDFEKIEIKKEVDRLIECENLNVPKLILNEKKEFEYVEKLFLGQELPSPCRFIENYPYKIEFIVRKVKFKGNSLFFEYGLSTMTTIFQKIDVYCEHLEVEQTNWKDGILNNEKGIKKLNEDFKRTLDLLETNLSELNIFTDQKKEMIRKNINEYIEQKKQNILNINMNIERLNEY